MNPPERFERLYNDHREDLYAYLVRGVREENAALDLLHDVFLNFFRAYREKALPGDDTQCRMYLFRTARNLMINFSGKAYRRREQLVEDYSAHEHSVTARRPHNTTEDQLVNRMNEEAAEKILRDLLVRLPEEERTALVLRHTLDARLEDIATILDVSVATASRLVRRAERRIADLARKEGAGAEFPAGP